MSVTLGVLVAISLWWAVRTPGGSVLPPWIPSLLRLLALAVVGLPLLQLLLRHAGAGRVVATLLSAGALVTIGVWCVRRVRGTEPVRWRRGSQVLETSSVGDGWPLLAGLWVPRRGKTRPAPAGGVCIAGVPVPLADETKHFKFIGTTGAGKSTAIHAVLSAALRRGDRAVIADPDGGYLARHYDAARGDVILNPFMGASARWSPFLELRDPHDARELARAWIGSSSGESAVWHGYAETFLAAVLSRLAALPEGTPEELLRILGSASLEELRALLSMTSAAPLVEAGNERMFGSVRAITMSRLAVLPELIRAQGPPFAVRDWIDAGRGVLFLPYRANEIATLRQIISTWLRLSIFQTMAGGEGGRPLWFVIDELDALGAIDGLKDALARLRKFGGRCVLGFQSLAQVSGTYGVAEARTIVENCATTLILRCSASEGGGTARFASHLIGQREVERLHESVSHSESDGRINRSLSRQVLLEEAVLPAQVEALADLEGYLKLASAPEWRRVRLPRAEARPAAGR